MLRRILQAHGGALPADAHVVFANTGKERLETLRFVHECAGRWDVPIRWVERDGSKPSGQRFREVDFKSAARAGEPFADLITERSFLPNGVMRFCTVALKIEVARDFMRSLGYERWVNVVGLRYDEPARVSKVRERDHGEWDVACPLYDARVTESDVLAWWKTQCFDLALRAGEGNCDLCFLKGRVVRERIMRERPDLAAWWIEQERVIGGRFHAHEPGYAATLDRVRRLPMLPMTLDPAAAPTDSLDTEEGYDARPCGCTD
ncbi:MAG: 3'-phosphoadenosine 5'-phosphosulfate sulfotransferase [Myxococcales bacterium]|nr:3'-phosphoadenosine 5'-phosphosulfate sulfotransferase [Myxococcales bacterium]